jgi:nicotinamide mononucleotide (NMN) deamidase PncC
VREKAGASVALSTTGIAGPSGATPAKPVGLVYIGLAGADGLAHVVRHEFRGGRLGVIDRTVTASLDLLRRGVLGLSLPPEVP